MNAPPPHVLGALLADYAAVPPACADVPITGLSADSRQIQPGQLFCALRGGQRHGLEFLQQVQAAGAVAVLWEPPWEQPLPTQSSVPLLRVPNLQAQLGNIASRFYAAPSSHLAVVGITGTDGKTSCTHFIAQALSATPNRACGMLGTLGVGIYGQTQTATHTTPGPLAVQSWLAQLVAEQRHAAVMEVSSHALDQGRVNGVDFAVAVLTQLSRDHLDYHGTVAAYAAAKRRLFVDHQPGWAVLNADDAFGQQLLAQAQVQHGSIAYGLAQQTCAHPHFVRGQVLRLDADGVHLHIQSSWGAGQLSAQLLGRFNASNLLASLATLLALGIPFDDALRHLQQTRSVPGRMERIAGHSNQALAVIDYAHTPHALEHALAALAAQSSAQQRVWCVFGCGGDRDAGKRPLMGAVAERYAHQVVVTDDNPRSENPQHIAQQILSGMTNPTAATLIHNRRNAIFHALHNAQAGDWVLIAGKGHEDYQIIGAERLPFSDRATAEDFFAGQPVD